MAGKEPDNVAVFGWSRGGRDYANLTQEAGAYTLWGFGGAPWQLTDVGRQLFVNTAFLAAVDVD